MPRATPCRCVYDELRTARRSETRSRSRARHPIQATALVHERTCRLVEAEKTNNGTAAGTSSPPRPRPCAASWSRTPAGRRRPRPARLAAAGSARRRTRGGARTGIDDLFRVDGHRPVWPSITPAPPGWSTSASSLGKTPGEAAAQLGVHGRTAVPGLGLRPGHSSAANSTRRGETRAVEFAKTFVRFSSSDFALTFQRWRGRGLPEDHEDTLDNVFRTIDLPATRSGWRNRRARTIGPYKLLQQIGEGGMGAVWMAEQTEPVTPQGRPEGHQARHGLAARSSPASRPSGRPWP